MEECLFIVSCQGKSSLKKGHLCWDLNVKEDTAKQQSEGSPFTTEGQVVEDPEAGMNLVYSQNRKEAEVAHVLWTGLRMAADRFPQSATAISKSSVGKIKIKTVTNELLMGTHFWTSNDHQETFNRKKRNMNQTNVTRGEVSESGRISTRVLAETVLSITPQINSVVNKINVQDWHTWTRGYLSLIKEVLKCRTHKWTLERNEYFWMCLS